MPPPSFWAPASTTSQALWGERSLPNASQMHYMHNAADGLACSHNVHLHRAWKRWCPVCLGWGASAWQACLPRCHVAGLFQCMARVRGPLWSMPGRKPLSSHQVRSGLSLTGHRHMVYLLQYLILRMSLLTTAQLRAPAMLLKLTRSALPVPEGPDMPGTWTICWRR